MSKKIFTGGRAVIKIGGREVCSFSADKIRTESKYDPGFTMTPKDIENIRKLLKASNSLAQGRSLGIEPLDIVLKSVTFNIGHHFELPQDTSTDEFTRYMDERASMTTEDLELEAFWELAAE